MQQIPPTGAQYEIRSGDQAAVVVEVGGGLRTYTVAGQEIIDGYREHELPPAAAGQVLAPWPNRLRDGRYHWHGADYQLALTEPGYGNAIHGLVRWLPWQAVAVQESSVTLACRLDPHPGYPWRLELTTTWSLAPEGLRAEHTASNLADSVAPFGLGAHPYVRPPGVGLDDVVLTIPAERRLVVDGRKLPLAAPMVTGTEWDFRGGRRIGAASLDTTFGEGGSGDGPAVTLSAPDGSRRVSVWADGAFGWWQVFTGDPLGPPRGRRALAVEPMTCPPDAWRSGHDVVALEPGGTWRGSWGIRPELG
ncbi:MAG: aldose epimerase [Actinobacteria bacterium]|nr:MAG: aldose epimerase [Actinomycetota bacterium]